MRLKSLFVTVLLAAACVFGQERPGGKGSSGSGGLQPINGSATNLLFFKEVVTERIASFDLGSDNMVMIPEAAGTYVRTEPGWDGTGTFLCVANGDFFVIAGDGRYSFYLSDSSLYASGPYEDVAALGWLVAPGSDTNYVQIDYVANSQTAAVSLGGSLAVAGSFMSDGGRVWTDGAGDFWCANLTVGPAELLLYPNGNGTFTAVWVNAGF